MYKSQPNLKPKPKTSSPPTIRKRKTKRKITHQNHKPIILSQSLPENPTTFAGNHQHPLETTATLIKNPPKPIARVLS